MPADVYTPAALSRIESELDARGTLQFARFPSGLFPASRAGDAVVTSGYANVWVRDNVYIALAHAVAGDVPAASTAAQALLRFFHRQTERFEAIISGAVSPDDVTRRPHVRFDGRDLTEITNEHWAHAQNDALGYFVWFYSRLARRGYVQLDGTAARTLSLFPRYFEAIRFWEDEDSGHWEERRRVSASSIGAVVAGLTALLSLLRDSAATDLQRQIPLVTDLIERGHHALAGILPHECAQLSPRQNRRYDAALLFLVFPLGVIQDDHPIVDLVLHDVTRFLIGPYGIRRYLGDSYWAPDYDTRLPPAERTRDFSDDVEVRDALLTRIGEEAQWCLFDPILSAYYGARFQQTGSASDRERQIAHFNRSLAQITDAWTTPELYYLRNGVYVPNPHTPLQWTQANLLMAVSAMRATLARGEI